MRSGVRYTRKANPSTPNAQRPTPKRDLELGVGRWELSVNHPFEKPGIGAPVAEHAIGGAVTQRDVPFVALPGAFGPPVPRRAPRARAARDAATAEPAPIDDNPDE